MLKLEGLQDILDAIWSLSICCFLAQVRRLSQEMRQLAAATGSRVTVVSTREQKGEELRILVEDTVLRFGDFAILGVSGCGRCIKMLDRSPEEHGCSCSHLVLHLQELWFRWPFRSRLQGQGYMSTCTLRSVA